MKLQIKIYIAIVFAVIVGGSFFYLKQQTEVLLVRHSETLHVLTDIEVDNQNLNQEVLNTAFRLYETYDKLNQDLEDIRKNTAAIADEISTLGPAYDQMRERMLAFEQAVEEKERYVQRFITLNALIKNSTTQIPGLTARYMKHFGHRNKEYSLIISQVTSAIFLARNALDADLLSGLDKLLESLKQQKFEDPDLEKFNRVFLSHAEVFNRYLPFYQPTFQKIMSIPTGKLLHAVEDEYVIASKHEVDVLSAISLAITAAFIASILLIIYFLFGIERNRHQLLALHEKMAEQATTDPVTELGNRFAFELEEEEQAMGTALLLLNIDGFKHINDFYGRRAGDAVLRHIGNMMAQLLPKELQLKVYRVGADDFGVLVPPNNAEELHDVADVLICNLEDAPFAFDSYHIPLRVSIGISHTQPLLETADLALRHIKQSRNKFLTYSKRLGLESNSENNLSTINTITNAIKRDAVVPYFMPLMRIKDQKIIGFECLIRIIAEDGKVLPPVSFLSIAKTSRLYGQLTCIMLDKSFEQFAHNDYRFSINFSIDDIMDEAVTNQLFAKLESYPEIGQRLTLEILESEGVENYELLQDFIARLKQYGCNIAIDDYGTGYSNLQHLVRLDIDSLKIDATLVKDLVSDPHTYAAVQTIVEMSAKLSISSTTAEFVASAELLEAAGEIGIDYAQGYYVGAPAAELRDIPAFLET